MGRREYFILCDESDKRGQHYCNFYAGVLVAGGDYASVSDRLNATKFEQNLHGEVKWQKVTDQYLSKYQTLMVAFFDELRAGRAKVRVMFRQAARVPQGLTRDQVDSEYFRLYYQFIKHAFGLQYLPTESEGNRLRLYFDQFPDTGEQVQQFRGYLSALQNNTMLAPANLEIRPEDITEVRSHDHVLLQCLDVVLGAMQFRLNDKHRITPPGRSRRGKRTIAKEKLYHCIRREICSVRDQPNFNAGITTGLTKGRQSRWLDAYRHWSFCPQSHEYDAARTKAYKRKNPT